MSVIAVGGFQHETNTFAPSKADYTAFEQGGGWPPLCFGDAIAPRLAGANILLTLLFQWYVITQLGVGIETDALFAGMALPTLILSVVSTSLTHVLVPLLATVAILALLHAMQPPPQLVVWSEGESGAQVARYQAWQLFAGLVRGHTRVPVPPQLVSAAAGLVSGHG